MFMHLHTIKCVLAQRQKSKKIKQDKLVHTYLHITHSFCTHLCVSTGNFKYYPSVESYKCNTSILMMARIHRTQSQTHSPPPNPDWTVSSLISESSGSSLGDEAMATTARFAAARGNGSGPPTPTPATTPPAQAQATQLIVLPASLHQVKI